MRAVFSALCADQSTVRRLKVTYLVELSSRLRTDSVTNSRASTCCQVPLPPTRPPSMILFRFNFSRKLKSGRRGDMLVRLILLLHSELYRPISLFGSLFQFQVFDLSGFDS